MNIEDGAFWFNPKKEKLYQQKNAKWEEQPDFEKQNMHVPILAEEYLKQEKLLIHKKLTKYLAEGHLDYLKSSSGSITYKNKQYIPVKGRVNYDYSSDPDIAAKQKELRQLKKVAEAIGTLESKQSPDSWRIKDIEVEQ